MHLRNVTASPLWTRSSHQTAVSTDCSPQTKFCNTAHVIRVVPGLLLYAGSIRQSHRVWRRSMYWLFATSGYHFFCRLHFYERGPNRLATASRSTQTNSSLPLMMDFKLQDEFLFCGWWFIPAYGMSWASFSLVNQLSAHILLRSIKILTLNIFRICHQPCG